MSGKVSISHGECEGSLTAFIKNETAKAPALLCWAEPEVTEVALDNATGRRADFKPLIHGRSDWPADLPLVEARLFWKTAALHVIATERGYRWARIEERADSETEVTRRAFSVLTLQDRQRFGLDDKGEELTAIEYWRDGRLIGWRLLPGEA